MSTLLWDGHTLKEGVGETPLVVDSYLMRERHVVRWDLYEQRFARSMPVDAYPFLAAVRAALPSTDVYKRQVTGRGCRSHSR